MVGYERRRATREAHAASHYSSGHTLGGHIGWSTNGVESVRRLIDPPEVPEFHELQYTFLSQVRHSEGLRERLAQLLAPPPVGGSLLARVGDEGGERT